MTPEIRRQRSQYRWRYQTEGDLDALDGHILRCIQNKPGINVAAIWRCISKRLEPPRLYVIHYRVKTLELAGIIETRRVANERRCFLKGVSND